MYRQSSGAERDIQPGATVWSADGHRLGTVARCEEDGFVLEAGALEGGLVLEYACVGRSAGGMTCLTVTAHEIPSRVRRIDVETSHEHLCVPSRSAASARARALELHAELRAAMREALGWANGVLLGDTSAELALRHAAVALACAARDHAAEEALELEPVLATVDAWGPERCARLEAHHRCELGAVEGSAAAAFAMEAEELARWVRRAVAELLRTLRCEEREILDPELLSDNPVRVDQLTD